MNKAKILSAAILAATCFGTTWAEAPDGYYNAAENQSGTTLLKKLHETIKGHHVVSYDGLWTVYATSDVREDGSIWDMYSTKHWTYQAEQCGNYKKVGDCYNREHSMPKSWFNDASPMVSDAFHIYPTDGKINNYRGNLPFGECEGGETESNGNVKGLGRWGTCTFPGYSGKVFEPDDEYKGDFARTYFYMATRYNDVISGWSSPMLAGNSYPAYTTWAVNLLMKWNEQDPVSDKERKRNDAVYVYQGNRNPFIDHPELADYIWGDKFGERWQPDGEGGTDPDPNPNPNPNPDPNPNPNPNPNPGPVENYSHTFGSGDVTTNGGSREWGTVTWETTALKYAGWNDNRGAQLGSANNSASTWSMSTDAFSGNEIMEVTVTATCAGNGSATVSADVDGNSFGSEEIDDSELKTCTFNNGGKAGRLTITFTNHASKAMYLHSVTVMTREPQSGIISATTAPAATVTPVEGGVEVNTGSEWIPVSIHSADGISWFNGEVSERERFELEPGIYIVRAAGKPHRILVK